MTPRITVFSAYRNASEAIARCIESVQSQDFTEFQHVIIDDCSTDDSLWYADQALKHASHDSRVWLMRRPSRQRKLANFLWVFPCFQGDIIVELDGDDWFARPDALSLIAAAYDANPRVEATAGSHRVLPSLHVATATTQPERGYRIMQSGFSNSVPAPRTWLRALTGRSLVECPALYRDPTTGEAWETNADLAMFIPALFWAEHIASIEDVLVEVNYASGVHDGDEIEGKQREEGLRLFEWAYNEEWRQNEHLVRPFRSAMSV